MLFTKLHIKNLYSFQDSILDFTFPKKPVNSTLHEEHPSERENINVKRFCVFTGGNASGKTAIGKVLCGVQNLIARGRSVEFIYNAICDDEKPAEIYAELISSSNNWLHGFMFKFVKSDDGVKGLPVEVEYAGVYITKSDNISSARKKLKSVVEKKESGFNSAYLFSNNFISFKESIPHEAKALSEGGWYYQLAQNTDSSIEEFDTTIKEDVLNRVLRAFDVSIESVSKVVTEGTGESHGYMVKFNNSDSVLIESDGGISQNKSDRFSRGTYDAIKVAVFLSRIMQDRARTSFSSTYFLDEAMAYAHSDLELAMINIIIDKLRPDAQFFYTTHNQEVLSLNVPVHSHYFIKKDEGGSHVIPAESILKKNDRPLKNILNSDIFGVLPDTTTLEEMLWE